MNDKPENEETTGGEAGAHQNAVVRSDALEYEDKQYKRFLIFAYDTYYPGGGLGDLQEECDTIEEVIDAFKMSEHMQVLTLKKSGYSEYFEVFDCLERRHVNLNSIGIVD